MKQLCETYKEKFLFFVEQKYFGKNSLDAKDMQAIVTHLTGCENCRKQTGAIYNHLQLLQSLPAPKIPGNLAAKCLWKIENNNISVWKPVYTYGIMLLLVFTVGMVFDQWYYQRSQKNDAFYALLNCQNQYITRLESLTKTRVEQPAQIMKCIEYLQSTSDQIRKGYAENNHNETIRQNLHQVIYQNILVLQDLCTYIEKNKTLPAFDVWVSQINQGQSQGSI